MTVRVETSPNAFDEICRPSQSVAYSKYEHSKRSPLSNQRPRSLVALPDPYAMSCTYVR